MATDITRDSKSEAIDALEETVNLPDEPQGDREWLSEFSNAVGRPLTRFAGTLPKKGSSYQVGESSSSEVLEDSESGQFGQKGFAGVNERWDDVQNLDARILELRPESVKVEVLLDREKRRFQDRVFPRDLLEGAVPLEEGRCILFRRLKGKGKIKFTFEDGSRVVDEDVFEDKSRFRDLDEFDFDKEL